MYVKDKLEREEKVGVAPFMNMGGAAFAAAYYLLLDSTVVTGSSGF